MKRTAVEGATEIAIPAQQAQAAFLLATGLTTVAVAAELNVSRTTLWRWARSPLFETVLRQERARLMEGLREYVEDGRLQSMRVLREVMASPTASAREKIAAARTFLAETTAPVAETRAAPKARKPVKSLASDFPIPDTPQERQKLVSAIKEIQAIVAERVRRGSAGKSKTDTGQASRS